MNILFLTPYPKGSAPSQRFRFELFFEALRAKGWSYQVKSFWDEKTWHKLYEGGSNWIKTIGLIKGFGRRKWLMLNLKGYDIIFIHREAAPIGPPVFEWFIAQVLKKKIVYDFDDAIWLPNTSDHNSMAGRLKWHSKVGAICRWSWKVSVGNEYLADYAGQYCEHVAITPTVVNTSVHISTINSHLSTPNSQPVLGWTGSHSTLKYLNSLLPMLQRLEQSLAFTFVVIADKDPLLSLKHYRFIKWSKDQEIDDLNELDIGLMPLEDDQWSKGKCGFKAIQYGAVGIPALVSPVGVNQVIVEHGVTGFHCSTDKDWETAISTLIANQELRLKMGQAGRKRIIKHYSVESEKERFLALFD
ncbi:MAG: glycosyltransferase family 4 protein [Cyclobacteriaceae bacterium]